MAFALAGFMVAAGLAHFVFPNAYRRIVPRLVGDPAFWVRWTGVAEIACAGLLIGPRTRRVGALATAALLVVVFPANVKMALDGGIAGQPFPLGSPVVAWVRLPLQVPLVLWAWRVAAAGRGPPRRRRSAGRPADAASSTVRRAGGCPINPPRPRPAPSPRTLGAVERSVLQGLAAFRWGAWLWMATVLLVSRDQLEWPMVAIALVGLALAVTIADTVLLRTDVARLCRPGPVLVELAVGSLLVVGDGLVYGPDHAFSTSQSLGSVWPLAGILGSGVALGPVGAGLSGIAIGLCRVAAVLLNGAPIDSGGKVLSLTNTVVFYALGGAAAGYLARLLRRAESEISAARAREEVARTLHDGVLQTLAIVERRATDPALARMAREQERDLRDYLFGVARAGPGSPPGAAPETDVGTPLRAAAARCEDAFGSRVQVLVAEDLPDLPAASVSALAGAAAEAMMNAGKHGRASKVLVYVEPHEDGGVFCSVKDDGAGFDVAATAEGVGLSRSIRGRMSEVGGRVEITSSPGQGTEVVLWLP